MAEDQRLTNIVVQAMCDPENQPHQWMGDPAQVVEQLGLADTERLSLVERLLAADWLFCSNTYEDGSVEHWLQDPDDVVHDARSTLREVLDEAMEQAAVQELL